MSVSLCKEHNRNRTSSVGETTNASNTLRTAKRLFRPKKMEPVLMPETTNRAEGSKLRRKCTQKCVYPDGYHIVNHKDVHSGLYPIEQTGLYVTIEEQAQRVREMYRRYAGGCSLQDLCKWLNSSDVPTPRSGRYWASPTVRLTLMNEANKGIPAFGKWIRINDESRANSGFKQTFTQRLKPA